MQLCPAIQAMRALGVTIARDMAKLITNSSTLLCSSYSVSVCRMRCARTIGILQRTEKQIIVIIEDGITVVGEEVDVWTVLPYCIVVNFP